MASIPRKSVMRSPVTCFRSTGLLQPGIAASLYHLTIPDIAAHSLSESNLLFSSKLTLSLRKVPGCSVKFLEELGTFLQWTSMIPRTTLISPIRTPDLSGGRPKLGSYLNNPIYEMDVPSTASMKCVTVSINVDGGSPCLWQNATTATSAIINARHQHHHLLMSSRKTVRR